MTWVDMFERWALVEADLHDVYGIDLDDPALMYGRTWRWLRARIAGLASSDTRTLRALRPPEKRR